MIQTLCDIGEAHKIPRYVDGAVYALHTDCVCGGIGDEFLTTTNSLTAIVQSGQAILCGNFFFLTGTETITLVPNTTAFLCVSIDITKPNGSRGYISFKLENDIKQENINGAGTLRDMPIYKITTNSNEATSLLDVRQIVQNGDTSFGAYHIMVLTQAEYNALGSYDNNTIYMIKG